MPTIFTECAITKSAHGIERERERLSPSGRGGREREGGVVVTSRGTHE